MRFVFFIMHPYNNGDIYSVISWLPMKSNSRLINFWLFSKNDKKACLNGSLISFKLNPILKVAIFLQLYSYSKNDYIALELIQFLKRKRSKHFSDLHLEMQHEKLMKPSLVISLSKRSNFK